jgi:hypothetical protein
MILGRKRAPRRRLPYTAPGATKLLFSKALKSVPARQPQWEEVGLGLGLGFFCGQGGGGSTPVTNYLVSIGVRVWHGCSNAHTPASNPLPIPGQLLTSAQHESDAVRTIISCMVVQLFCKRSSCPVGVQADRVLTLLRQCGNNSKRSDTREECYIESRICRAQNANSMGESAYLQSKTPVEIRASHPHHPGSVSPNWLLGSVGC